MLKTTIEITEDIENIKKLLSTDNFEAKTSKVTTSEENNILKIIIKSEDIVSMRASINGITAMLSVYYQTKKID
jgi:tRNA threonylcarbamoyladenosine modification (KEOPS) complex  Pcc1 subunit